MNHFPRLFAFVLLAVLPSNPRAADLPAAAAPTETVITSDQMEAHSTDTETFCTFTGNVHVVSNNVHIECDRLDTISSRSGDKSEIVGTEAQFKHLQADGHVRITQGDRDAICGHAEVKEGQDKIILTQDPVIIDHSNGTRAAGDTITLLRSLNKILIDHARILAPPMKDFNLDKSQLAPSPATPPPAPAPTPP
jgi:lipopolysaccharide export system protein LptA